MRNIYLGLGRRMGASFYRVADPRWQGPTLDRVYGPAIAVYVVLGRRCLSWRFRKPGVSAKETAE